MSGAGYDRTITVFSPEGRLYQIEYAFKAVKNSNLTSVAVKGSDCVVLVSQKKVQDKLLDASSITNLYPLTKRIGAVMCGLPADARAAVLKARELASTFQFDNGYEVSADYLAKLVADKHQVFTQHASKRSLATYMILGGVDPECGPSLHRVDPAGHVLGYKACAAGVKEAEAMNWLEKKYTGDELPSQEDAISMAIDCLQTVLSTDLKATDLEVAVITESNPYVYTALLAELPRGSSPPPLPLS